MTSFGGWLQRLSSSESVNVSIFGKIMSPNLTKCFAMEIKLRYFNCEKFIVVANSNNTGSDNSFAINQLLIK